MKNQYYSQAFYLYFLRAFILSISIIPVSLGAQISFTVTNIADSGAGSLRQAIIDANNTSGKDTIKFNIAGTGPHTIQPASALPDITDPLIIDGTSKPDYAGTPVIELDGTNAGSSGLSISAGNSTIRALVINRFLEDGIKLVSNGNNIIEGNYIGTDITGSIAQGNGTNGIMIVGNCQANRIGTNGDGIADNKEKNIVSGNHASGIIIRGQDCDHNIVAGNYIGTDVSGTTALGNSEWGVGVWYSAKSNLIGTDGDGLADTVERNIISGNGLRGIALTFEAEQNVVAGNYIGTDITGTVAIPNQGGIEIANGAHSNLIGTNADGVSDDVERNIISGNAGIGINMFIGVTENEISGNFIGVDRTGTAALGNEAHGLMLGDNAWSNVIGGTSQVKRNVISANAGDGVYIYGTESRDNWITGNYIGTDSSGTADLGNLWAGIELGEGAHSNLIGDTTGLNYGNIIAFNKENGVALTNEDTKNNRILGNEIHSNSGIGIDLGKDRVSPNDYGDTDTGPNNLQNYPRILLTEENEKGELLIKYNVESSPLYSAYPLLIQFFESEDGEGNLLLGEDTYIKSDFESSSKTVNLGKIKINEGSFIVATATDSDGNTSEFSQQFCSESLINLTHTPGNLNIGIFNNGILGIDRRTETGPGIMWKGENGLWNGGLVFSTSAAARCNGFPFLTSDLVCDSSSFSSGFAADNIFDQITRSTLRDAGASSPFNVTILQFSYTNTGDEFCYIRYGFINTNNNALTDFYAGLYMDWDIGEFDQNDGGYDFERDLVYNFSHSGSAYYFGFMILDSLAGARTINLDPLTRAGVFTCITTYNDTIEAPGDLQSMGGTGPFDIPPGDTAWVTFAIVAGDDLENLLQHADSARKKALILVWIAKEPANVGSGYTNRFPIEFNLFQNYPNPFNPVTNIKFQIPSSEFVTLKVYNILGEEVKGLIGQRLKAGLHQYRFNARDLTSGIYYYQIVAGKYRAVKKMILIR